MEIHNKQFATSYYCVIVLSALLSMLSPKLFSQSCIPVSVPFSEGFESYAPTDYGTAGVMPTCWNVLTTGSQAIYHPHVSRQVGVAYDGNYLLMSSASNRTHGANNYVILPSISVDLNELHISFDSKMQNTIGHLILGYFTDIADEATFVDLDTIPTSTLVVSHDISLYHRGIASNARLAFKWSNNTISTNCYLDNVFVDFETCVPVSEVRALDVTMNSATIKWNPGRDESMWNVEYGPTGYERGHAEQTMLAYGSEILLQNLEKGKTYDLYVQAICHEDNPSAYSDVLTFVSYCFELGDTTYEEVCGSYTWRGKDYARSGFYYDTVPSVAANGCDSIYTLALTVHQNYELFDTLNICSNDLPLGWCDTVFALGSVDSNYVFQRKSAFGCDSVVHLAVFVHPVFYREDTLSICMSDLPYRWNDTLFGSDTRTGTYVFTRASRKGCDSIVYLHLTVNASYHQTEVLRICQQDLPYKWRDTTFMEGTFTEVYTFQRTAANGCDSVVDLLLIVRPTYYENVSLQICRADLPYKWRDVIILEGAESGMMTFNRTTSAGCDSIIEVQLTIMEPAVEEVAISICESELPYKWRDTTFAVGTRSGSYEFLSDEAPCGKRTILYLTVHPLPIVTQTYFVCSTDLPYTVADTLFKEGTVSGTYTLHRTSSFGCDSTIIVRLTVLDASDQYETLDLCRDELPITVFDTTFSATSVSGNYVLSRYLPNGCMRKIYLDVNVHDGYVLNDTMSICASDLPTIWRGHVLSRGVTSGDYTIEGTTMYGCDSVLNLHLEVYPSYRLYDTLRVCQNDLPYEWRDTTFGTDALSGVYFFERQSQWGCDSMVFLRLIINESKSSEVYETWCSSKLPYEWRDTVFDANTPTGDYVFHRLTSAGCDSIVTLHLQINPSYEQEDSLTICSNDLPYRWRDTTFEIGTTSAIFEFNRTTALGCDSLVRLNLTVIPAYMQVFTDTICDNILPWTWNDTLFEVGTVSGTYTRTHISTQGCDSIVVLNLVVNQSSETYIDLEICQNDLPYTWEDEEHTFPIGASSGTFTFLHTAANGCDSTVYLQLTIHQQYELSLTESVCENEFPYQWRDTVFEAGTTSGEYVFHRLSQYGCDSVINLTLLVNELPVVQILGDTTIDRGEATMLVATYGAGNSYVWDDGTLGNILNVAPDTTTTYYLTVTNNDGCSNMFPITVYVATGLAAYSAQLALEVHPNPTDGKIHVSTEYSTVQQVELYDLQGALVRLSQTSGALVCVDYSDVAVGTYLLKVKLANNAVIVRKLMIY